MKSTSYPPNKKVVNALSRLLEYPMKLSHVSAKINGAADALSRLFKKTVSNVLNNTECGGSLGHRIDKILKNVKGDKSLTGSHDFVNLVWDRVKKVKFGKYHISTHNSDEKNIRSILKNSEGVLPLFGKKSPEKNQKPPRPSYTPVRSPDGVITRQKSRQNTPKSTTPSQPIPSTSDAQQQEGKKPNDAETTAKPTQPRDDDNVSKEKADDLNYETSEEGLRRSSRVRNQPDRYQASDSLEKAAKKRAERKARRQSFQVFLPVPVPTPRTIPTPTITPKPMSMPTQTPIPIQRPITIPKHLTQFTEQNIKRTLPQTIQNEQTQPPISIQKSPEQYKTSKNPTEKQDINDNLPHKYYPEDSQLFEESRPKLTFKNRFHGTIPDAVRKRIRELAKRNYKLNLDRESLKFAQIHDPRLRGIYLYLQDEFLPSDVIKSQKIVNQAENYLLCGDLLFFCPNLKSEIGLRLKLAIPESFSDFIIDFAHSKLSVLGHSGYTKCYYYLHYRYSIPKLGDKLAKHIKSCLTCLQSKNIRQNDRIGLPLKPTSNYASRPFQKLEIDHFNPFLGREIAPEGYSRVLVITDCFSKYVYLKACKGESALETSAHLLDIFSDKGPCETLISDRGTGFCSQVFKSLRDEYKYKHNIASAQSHQTVGGAENCCKGAKSVMKSILLEDPSLDIFSILSQIQLKLNTAPHKNFKHLSPFEIVNGYAYIDEIQSELGLGKMCDMDDPDLLDIPTQTEQRYHKINQLLQKHIQNYKHEFDSRLKSAPTFVPGDIVLVHSSGKLKTDSSTSKKLKRNFKGPYRVISVLEYHVILADLKSGEIQPDQYPIRTLVKIDKEIGIADNFPQPGSMVSLGMQ